MLDTPLFHNKKLRKWLSLQDVRDIIDWMTREEGLRRAEWVGTSSDRSVAYIYWRRPEEWAEIMSNWVAETGQKNTVFTLFELTQGESTMSQEFYSMDPDILQKTLQVLVKRNKAQIFGSQDELGVKFF
ncbi:MAG: hypothetical protein LQ340_007349 [Diploschistes diacapsis]|nr:MAG: hypothetical protein LQ340_007349 [Diploschistes diacapsis]